MSEEKEALASEAKSALVEAYKDVGRPVLAPLGKTLGTTIEVALAPVNLIVGGLKAGIDRFKAVLTKKVEDVPPQRLLPPPPTIAAPAALQYALLGEGDEVAALRTMFENLVARSMDLETSKDVHPAFVTLISQLTPDEARLLRNINDSDYSLLWVETVEEPMRCGIVSFFSHGTGVDMERMAAYLSNLDRLGILRIDREPDEIRTDNMDELYALARGQMHPNDRLSLYGVAYLTPFGAQFLATCVHDPVS